MPGVIDPQTLHVDKLPGVWAPVQWDQTADEQIQETENQANASLLTSVDIPEAILRLLLNETEIEQTYDAPQGYDPAQQGEWDPEIITYVHRRPVRLLEFTREADRLTAEYDFGDLGRWLFEIQPERVTIERL